jgi:hypothetical protein
MEKFTVPLLFDQLGNNPDALRVHAPPSQGGFDAFLDHHFVAHVQRFVHVVVGGVGPPAAAAKTADVLRNAFAVVVLSAVFLAPVVGGFFFVHGTPVFSVVPHTSSNSVGKVGARGFGTVFVGAIGTFLGLNLELVVPGRKERRMDRMGYRRRAEGYQGRVGWGIKEGRKDIKDR